MSLLYLTQTDLRIIDISQWVGYDNKNTFIEEEGHPVKKGE